MAETVETTYDADGELVQRIITAGERAQSSISITTNSKGEPQPSISRYCENDEKAMTESMFFVTELYKQMRRELGMLEL